MTKQPLGKGVLRLAVKAIAFVYRAVFGVYRAVVPQKLRTKMWEAKNQVIAAAQSKNTAPTGEIQAIHTGAAQPSPPTQYDVICFPVVTWDSRFQRPQQILTQFAQDQHRVFYIYPLFTGLNRRRVEVKNVSEQVYELYLPGHPDVYIYSSMMSGPSIPIALEGLDAVIRSEQIDEAVLLVQHPFWEPLAVDLKERYGWRIVYDCMDDHGGFENNPAAIERMERLLIRQTNLLVVTAGLLEQKFKDEHENIILVPNAGDYEHFSQLPAETKSPIADLPHPVIGYYGAIAEWFDSDLISQAAKLHPEWTFALIGRTKGANLKDLPKLDNVHLLGEKPYEDLPEYLVRYDVCIIPFIHSPLTEATNPVKLFEYLAAGKPVVARELTEIKPYADLIYLYHDLDSFTAQIEQALTTHQPDQIERGRAFASQNTWGHRYRMLKENIQVLYGRASIIMVTTGNFESTRLALQNILEKTIYPNYEIIVVDNGSSAGLVNYLEQMDRQYEQIRVIFNEGDPGFAGAKNVGIEQAEGSAYIVLLNDDVIVTQGWLTTLLRHLRDPAIGIVGPVTNRIDNKARINVPYTDLSEMDAFARSYTSTHRGRLSDLEDFVMFCAALRCEVVDQIGPFDEQFELSIFDDDDYTYRLKQHGYRAACAEDVFVHRFGASSSPRLEDEDYQRLFEEERRKYEEKWGIPWEPRQTRSAALFYETGRMPLPAIYADVEQRIHVFKNPYYLAFYEEMFEAIRNEPLNILEVGIYKGGSLVMFAEYFRNARLVGIDINKPDQEMYDELERPDFQGRVSIAIGSQDDRQFLDRIINEQFVGQPLDIVIDDASHMYAPSKVTFEHVFYKYLKSDGLYIIEDWGAGYWPKWPDGNPDGQHGLPQLIKELVDEVALRDRTILFEGERSLPVNEEQDSEIKEMIVRPSIVAVRKFSTLKNAYRT